MLPEITIGPLTVPTYGKFLIAGGLAFLVIIAIRAKRAGLPATDLYRYTVPLWAIALIGGAAWHALVYQPGEITLQSVLNGQSIIGSIAALVLGAPIAGRVLRIPWLRYTDVIAPGLAAMQAIVKVACFLVGCCYGTACSLPWAIEGRHPVQLYEAGAITFIAGVLWLPWLQRSMGRVTGAYLALYGLERFLAEFIRADSLYSVAGLTPSQILAAVVGCFGGWLLARKRT